MPGMRALSNLPQVCGIVGVITSPPDTGHMIPYFLLGTTKYALVSVVSSLATNVLATSLIAYQAWCVLFIFILYGSDDVEY